MPVPQICKRVDERSHMTSSYAAAKYSLNSNRNSIISYEEPVRKKSSFHCYSGPGN